MRWGFAATWASIIAFEKFTLLNFTHFCSTPSEKGGFGGRDGRGGRVWYWASTYAFLDLCFVHLSNADNTQVLYYVLNYPSNPNPYETLGWSEKERSARERIRGRARVISSMEVRGLGVVLKYRESLERIQKPTQFHGSTFLGFWKRYEDDERKNKNENLDNKDDKDESLIKWNLGRSLNRARVAKSLSGLIHIDPALKVPEFFFVDVKELFNIRAEPGREGDDSTMSCRDLRENLDKWHWKGTNSISGS